MALYFLFERSNIPIDQLEPSLRLALEDKDSSVVFASLSIWKLILVVRSSFEYRKKIVFILIAVI